MNFQSIIHNKYVLYGGLAVAAFAGYKLLFTGGSGGAASGGGEAAATNYPDVTYAATPIQSNGGILGTSSGDVGTSALEALRDALKPDSAVTLAQITQQEKADTNKSLLAIFSSLTTTLKAQTGLHYIRAIVPGLGTVVVTNSVPKVPPKPKPKPKTGGK